MAQQRSDVVRRWGNEVGYKDGVIIEFLRWCAAWFVGPTDAREQIIDMLDDTLRRNRNGSYKAHAIILEIDNFADIRHYFSGRDVRHLLHVVEQRLKGDCFLPDVVRRLDGDQFAVAVSPMRGVTAQQLGDLCATAQRLIAKPIQLSHGDIKITACVGCASSDHCEAPDGEALLEAARIAVIDALHHGESRITVYTEALAAKIAARRDLLKEAVQAIDNGDFQAFFQPQISLSTHRISGFEALARWDHKVRGMISPGEFLPLLEDAGMMRHLGGLMLRDALRHLQSWDDAGFDAPTVSVNMSAEELRDPNLIDLIKFELDARNLPPSRLVIEVLETVVAQGPSDRIVENLQQLSHMGCSIDLDDFGTGQASITTLRDFAIKRIKIDKSFVSHIADDPGNQKMVDTMLAIAKSLSIETLAEGIERAEELERLTKGGCEHAQGYLIAKPLHPDDATLWISARQSAERRVS